jgi:hypothetical protein
MIICWEQAYHQFCAPESEIFMTLFAIYKIVHIFKTTDPTYTKLNWPQILTNINVFYREKYSSRWILEVDIGKQ